jgi:hydrogenase expression/formation protein HypC
MCLGTPARVVTAGDFVGTVEMRGEVHDVALHLLDEPVAPGDWVLVHLGFARRRIALDELADTLAAYAQITGEAR